MNKFIKLRLTDKNENLLNKLNGKTKIPITKIINIALSELETKGIDLLEENEDKKLTIIKFRITESEKKFLQDESLKSGAEKITTEIKFRLLNSINKNKFFTSNELKEFIKTRYELNMIGRNLNQLVKKLNSKEESIIESEDIKEIVVEINLKLKKFSKLLEEFIIHTNHRF